MGCAADLADQQLRNCHIIRICINLIFYHHLSHPLLLLFVRKEITANVVCLSNPIQSTTIRMELPRIHIAEFVFGRANIYLSIFQLFIDLYPRNILNIVISLPTTTTDMGSICP